jgi:hypothetical protein
MIPPDSQKLQNNQKDWQHIQFFYLPLQPMKLNERRQWCARVLLAVLLPIQVLSALHLHNYAYSEEDECEACVEHIAHSGHFSTHSHALHECVLCEFLGLSYVAAAAVVVGVPGVKLLRLSDSGLFWLAAAELQSNASRAPPVAWM